MKFTSLIVFLTTLSIGVFSQAAQVYKWVDEKGQTQFSQFPPATTKTAEQISVKTSQSASTQESTDKLNDMRQKLLENSVGRNVQTEEKKLAEEDAKIKAKNCSMAKQKVRDLEANGRVYKTLENGEREWYDVEGRAKLIKTANADVTKYCS